VEAIKNNLLKMENSIPRIKTLKIELILEEKTPYKLKE
jgi:hypothetical protein